MAPPPPQLVEELVEEILLRLPPDDSASLVRAALVCRLWRRLASAPAFRRRFREFHRTAPVLGVLCPGMEESNDDEADWPITTPTARFISTSSFRPARADHYNCGVVDARHGRVLLERYRDPLSRGPLQINLIAWDPITDEQQQLPTLYPPHSQWKAAVVCAAAGSGGCDHLDCHQGPFLVLVVFMGSETMFTMIYASEANAWSEAASANPRYLHNFFETSTRGVLLGNTLYFLTHHFPEIRGILKYDMVTQEISTTDLACKFSYDVLENIVLMTTEDGRLGLATTDTCNGRLGLATTDTCKLIQLWSMEDGGGSDRVARFVHSRVIDLEKLLPASALDEGIIDVNSFADDARVLFVVSKLNRVYSIDMKSEQVKQVPGCNKWCWVFPYTSFHTPALGAGSAGGPPRSSGSSNP